MTDAMNEREQRAFQMLMELDRKEAMASLALLRDAAFMDKWTAFCKKHRLAKLNTSHLRSAADVTECATLVTHTLRSICTSAQHLALLVKRLLEATRIVQRFIRKRLKDLRRRKDQIATAWKSAEADSRHKIRASIDSVREKGRGSIVSQRMAESLWSLYMDCWSQTETVQAAVERLWWDRRCRYIEKFREWRNAKVQARRHLVSQEALVTRRIAESKIGITYPPPQFSLATVSLDDVAYQLLLVQLRRPVDPIAVMRIDFQPSKAAKAAPAPSATAPKSGDEGRPAQQHGNVVTFAPQAMRAGAGGADLLPVSAEAPVNYYHALIRYDPNRMHFPIFLKRILSGEKMSGVESASKSIQKQLALATATVLRWQGGRPSAAAVEAAEQKKHTIAPDGTPLARYGTGLAIPSPRSNASSTRHHAAAAGASDAPSVSPPTSPTRRPPTASATTPRLVSPALTTLTAQASVARPPALVLGAQPHPPATARVYGGAFFTSTALEREAAVRAVEAERAVWEAKRRCIIPLNTDVTQHRKVAASISDLKRDQAAARRPTALNPDGAQLPAQPLRPSSARSAPRVESRRQMTTPAPPPPRSMAATMILSGRGGAFITSKLGVKAVATPNPSFAVDSRPIAADDCVRWTSVQ